MEMTYVLVAGSTVLELLCIYFVAGGLAGTERGTRPWEEVLFGAAVVGYILAVPDGYTTGSYVLILLYIKRAYGKGWKDSLVVTVLSVVMVGVAELVCYFPFAFVIHGCFPDMVNNLLASLCSTVPCFFVSRCAPVRHLVKWCRRREAACIAVVAFSLVLMLTAIVNFSMTMRLDLGDYIYITACIVLVWWLSLRLMRYHYEERARRRYYEAFCSVIDQIRRKQHRFKNQLDTVYSMHSLYHDYGTLVEEQRKYLGKLADCEMPSDVLVLGNPVVVAHVYGKVSEAQEAGLRLRMRLRCSLEGCGIGDIHMVEILGTLFDNAVEDMGRSGEKEFLVFEAEECADGDGYVVRVANPHERLGGGEIWRMFENGYSTKGEGRGIGLYHVKKLVGRYGADLVAENREIEGRNYLCFSLVTGRKTPLA